MRYSEIVKTYEEMEKNSSKIAKTQILAELLKKTPDEEMEMVTLLIQGVVFPKYTGYDLGIAQQLMLKAISKATGIGIDKVEKIFKESGDLGIVAEQCIKERKQVSLFKKELDVETVFKNLQKLAFIAGEGAQDKKLSLISELLSFAKPEEAKYLVRTILGDLRVGVAEGIIRDAIVEAFLTKEDATALEYAMNIYPNLGEIALLAKQKGLKGLKEIKVKLGQPIQVMLGEKAESIKEVVEKFGKVAAEYKYDGMRAQIHKDDEKIWIFTRRLEDVTKQFPDLVELCRKHLKPKKCIVEGEVIAVRDSSPLPFQVLSQRIQRKYDIEKMVKEIPIQINLFDIVLYEDEMLFDKTLLERRKILEKSIEVKPNKFMLAKQIVTDDISVLEIFYKEALDAKQEGIFLKVLDAKYIFGRHVGGWYKIKPTLETLDLAIVGATWGTGKRAGWLGSFILACRDEKTGKFLECGMLGTGVKEKKTSENDVTFEELTKLLKPLIIFEKGNSVRFKPKIVVSVDYQEIQMSPNYESGFALRFPRFVALRYDKGAEEVDTIERIKYLYELQKKTKK
ncbi:MAG: ATP-dependent DNA ligase [Candidatus Aenigmarchaeota archaeon]|nr:ATP-dependent DNA ligase [Candidatus Aenigmarchaeota archaeon]MCX8179570.1 ATP-dependent DNA ligase [Candidatus Aenigmarchaeota archaeon]